MHQLGDPVDKALIIETGCAKVHRQTRPGLRGCPDRTGEVQDSHLSRAWADMAVMTCSMARRNHGVMVTAGGAT